MKFSAVLFLVFTLAASAIPLYCYRDSLVTVPDSSSQISSMPVLAESSQTDSSSIADSSAANSSPAASSEDTASSDVYELSQNSSRPATTLSTEDIQDLEYLKIYNLTTGKVEKVAMQDYVRGAVAAEMPPTFHAEAMKAQAVAAHTYALYQHYFQQQFPNEALHGADFAADPANIKGYATEKAMRKRYGNMADEYWNKITSAADSVLGYTVVYQDQPVIAAYHSACGGKTEDASNVWSSEVPYLQAVSSPGDMLSPQAKNVVKMPIAQVRAKLETAFEGVKLQKNPDDWINITEVSPSGYALLVDVGNISVHGKDLRTALGLKSSYVDIAVDKSDFTFTTTGYGHGVGMSQYGADYMARQGSTFDEILTHYYTGAELAIF